MSTLARVAEHAGVGIGTVSRVLNDSPNVSPEMRAKVQAAIAEVGYVRQRKQRAGQGRRPGYVGVLVTFFDEPSSYQRLRGIVSRLQPYGMQIALYNIASPGQARETVMELPRHDALDGLIVISLPLTDAEGEALAAARFPTVLVDTWSPTLPSVRIDDRVGGRMATQHLLDLGHRRIAFVGEPRTNPFGFVSSARREDGYRQVLAEAGIDVDPALVRHGAHLRSASRRMTLELFSLSEPPTAIVAASDVQAVGVMEAAEQLGVRIPDELSVVGYDDIELAQLMGITTVRQPLEDSGRRVADLIVQAITTSVRHAYVEEMELELVVRSTTGPLR